MNKFFSTFLILLVLVAVLVGGYYIIEKDISTPTKNSPEDTPNQSHSNDNASEYSAKKVNLTDESEQFSISGVDDKFDKVVFNPLYVVPGESQEIIVKLKQFESIEKVKAEAELDSSSKSLTFKKVNTSQWGNVFYTEWTPEGVTADTFYPVEISYVTKQGKQGKIKLTWKAQKEKVGFWKSLLIPSKVYAAPCSVLELNADGDTEIKTSCSIDGKKGVKNGNLKIQQGYNLTLAKGSELHVYNGDLIVKGTIQMYKNSTIYFSEGHKISPEQHIAKPAEGTVIKKGADALQIKECVPGATTTESDTCSFRDCEGSDCNLSGSETLTKTIDCKSNGMWEDVEVNASSTYDCSNKCDIYDHKECYHGDVWWYNSCTPAGRSESSAEQSCDNYSNSTCDNGSCTCNPTSESDACSGKCGTVNDDCGNTYNCGSCTGGDSCYKEYSDECVGPNNETLRDFDGDKVNDSGVTHTESDSCSDSCSDNSCVSCSVAGNCDIDSSDYDEYKVDGVCGYEECECSSGDCCDGCNYYGTSHQCGTDYDYDYGCPWGTGCGDNVGKRHRTRPQYCSGNSSGCNGDYGSYSDWSGWDTDEYCGSNEVCNSSGYCDYKSSCAECRLEDYYTITTSGGKPWNTCNSGDVLNGYYHWTNNWGNDDVRSKCGVPNSNCSVGSASGIYAKGGYQWVTCDWGDVVVGHRHWADNWANDRIKLKCAPFDAGPGKALGGRYTKTISGSKQWIKCNAGDIITGIYHWSDNWGQDDIRLRCAKIVSDQDKDGDGYTVANDCCDSDSGVYPGSSHYSFSPTNCSDSYYKTYDYSCDGYEQRRWGVGSCSCSGSTFTGVVGFKGGNANCGQTQTFFNGSSCSCNWFGCSCSKENRTQQCR